MSSGRIGRFVVACGLSVAFCLPVVVADSPYRLSIPTGLQPPKLPEDDPLTAGKIELGKQLFFDPRLSRDNSTSCATCHDPAQGWSNGQRYGEGVEGRSGRRNVPTLVNVAYQRLFFWDGRADSLELQVHFPAEGADEFDLSLEKVAARLNEIAGYREQFEREFGGEATPDRIAQAIATFERTIIAGNSPFDRFRAGDLSALSPAAQRGHDVFFFRTNCAFCHDGPNFTNGKFHNTGVGMNQPDPDLGRFEVDKSDTAKRGAFKTPTLRDLARTAPYMHDGSFATLKEVVEFYVRGGKVNIAQDPVINSFPITQQDKADLVVFLAEGLKSDSYPNPQPPELPK